MSTEEIDVNEDEIEVFKLLRDGKPIPVYGQLAQCAIYMGEKKWIVRHHGQGRNNYLLTYRGLAVARQLGIEKGGGDGHR